MEDKKQKKSAGQKLDELLAKPKQWAEKHPKIVGTFKFLGAAAFGAGLVIGGDRVVCRIEEQNDDDEDAVEVNATEIPIDSSESNDSEA